jgi:hypothetical protein
MQSNFYANNSSNDDLESEIYKGSWRCLEHLQHWEKTPTQSLIIGGDTKHVFFGIFKVFSLS